MINIKSDKFLLENGFTIIDLLDQIQVSNLLSYLNGFSNFKEGAFIATSHHKEKKLRKEISEYIRGIIELAVLSKVANAKLLGSSFLIKNPGSNGNVDFHRDWNIVDERVGNSYNLWISLTESNEQNGTLIVIKESHLGDTGYRGPGVKQATIDINNFKSSMIPIILKEGQAVLYDHKLIHGSFPNKTESPRINIVSGVASNDSEINIIYPSSRPNFVTRYTCYPDFFFDYNPEEGPTGLQLIEEIECPSPKSNWVDKIKQLIFK